MDKFGFSEDKIVKLQSLFFRYIEIEKVIIYGSRAKGNYQPFSDVDITLMGPLLNKHLLSKIILEIDDLLLPYSFDVSIFHEISNQDLIDHINRRGQILYNKEDYSEK